jgi:hypothetical protein
MVSWLPLPASTLPPSCGQSKGRHLKHRGGITTVSQSGGGSLPLEGYSGTPIVPHTDVPKGIGLLIHVRAVLDGSSKPAQDLYGKFIQEYAEKLASESARQEASARAPGARTTEITESVVIRAHESLDEQIAKRRRPAGPGEAVALAGMPILSSFTGVTGSYLHSPLQATMFTLAALGAVICVLYLLKRRLL